MGHGYRNMFYMTGLPGWLRFGYSPGWGGMPPAAQYLQSTGQLGQFMNWMGYPGAAGVWPYYGGLSREQELQSLKAQKEALERQLETLAKRLEELEKGA